MDRGILKYMADFRLMYKLTKLVSDKNTKQGEDLVMVGFAEDGSEEWLLLENEKDIVAEFSRVNKTSKYKTERILQSAIDRGFIERFSGYSGDGDKLKVKSGGDDFLFKRLGFHSGFLRAVINDNAHVVAVTTAIIIAVATVINVIIEVRK